MGMMRSAWAQVDIDVKVIKAQMSKGSQPCYVVDIPRGVLKDIQENWIKKLQENNKVKVVNNKGELVFSGVKSELSTDSIFVYTLFIEKEEWIVMNVFVEIDSVFFSPTEDKTQLSVEKTDNAIRTYVRNFAVEQYRLDATEDLEVEEKLLEQLQDEYDKLVKENENLKKDISSLENDIDKTERSITELEKEIELKNQEALSHTTGMATLATDPEKKAAEDKKKDLEKEKNKLEKERTGYKNDISDMKSDIENADKQIEENNELQEEKQTAIDAQAEEVKKAQATLDGIK
jgi:uncharacterized protein YhaN